MEGTRILATSDLHGLLDGLRSECNKAKPDVLVIAGDIQPAVIGLDVKDWFKRKFFRMVRALKCEVVAIPGNHDFCLAANADDIVGGMAPKNFHYLVDSGETVCGLRFHGTPWVPWISGHWCWESDEDDLVDKFAQIGKTRPHILVSHTPPRIYNCGVDVSIQNIRNRGPFGSTSLTKAILSFCPSHCICGHIHSGDHTKWVMENGTRVYNVSRVDERYQIAYKPTLIEIPDPSERMH